MTWEETAAKKRQERDSELITEWLIPESLLPTDKNVVDYPATCGYLSDKELEITGADAETIVNKIVDKEWSCYEVTEAFCHRTQIAHQLTNCLSEVFFKDALADAKKLDAEYASTGKTRGPLHGLPISLKDNMNVKGKASSVGIVSWCFDPEGGAKEDSGFTALLRDMGAILYCKTNTPLAMKRPETVNNIYGRTTNPMNRLLSPGGSSGGASAQCALNGCAVAIGSDVGGSVRMPSSFTGVYGLMPSYGRYPTYGTRSGSPGGESVHSIAGPLAKSLDSLEFFLKVVANANPADYDPDVIARPWKEVKLPAKLNFAVLWDDGEVNPTPPITRGIKIVIDLLKKNGHEVILWDPAEHHELNVIRRLLTGANGGKFVLDAIDASGEPADHFRKKMSAIPAISAAELWDLQAKRSALCNKFLQRWVQTAAATTDGRPIDAIILPATPFAGCPHEKFGRHIDYSGVFNTLDYSSGTIPVATADKTIDVADKDYVPRNEDEKNVWDNYDPEETDGGSISIQIACRKGEDEKVVALMRLIEAYLSAS